MTIFDKGADRVEIVDIRLDCRIVLFNYLMKHEPSVTGEWLGSIALVFPCGDDLLERVIDN